MLIARRDVFACHTTGTLRRDLPKGLQDAGESTIQTALREVWEETVRKLTYLLPLACGAAFWNTLRAHLRTRSSSPTSDQRP